MDAWFCAWFSHMVLGAMVFGPWYWMLRHVYIYMCVCVCVCVCVCMYCNIEWNMMKNQSGSPSFEFWDLGENICVYFFLCVMLSLLFISCY